MPLIIPQSGCLFFKNKKCVRVLHADSRSINQSRIISLVYRIKLSSSLFTKLGSILTFTFTLVLLRDGSGLGQKV